MTFLIRLSLIAVIVFMPFIALVRGAVLFHSKYNPGPFLSIAGGIVLTTLVLILYMTYIHSRLTAKIGSFQAIRERGIFASVLIIGFCIHGLFFMSTTNLKDDQLKSEIRQLHPIIRLAVSTVIVLDRDLIITDASRMPHDYKRMGLPENSSSLHYRQKDGYAYAVDLRTLHRPRWRNISLRLYFRMMGFSTLRHGGTADHLHISLKCHS